MRRRRPPKGSCDCSDLSARHARLCASVPQWPGRSAFVEIAREEQVEELRRIIQDDPEPVRIEQPPVRVEPSARAAVEAQVALADQADKLPQLLSGGQRARVSLLRALLAEPDALLLDEPFSRLDKPLRAAFRELVFGQIKALAIPAILVTHDAEDAPGTILNLTECHC